MESLYRKYRPLTFESVVGQQHIVSTLEHAVAEGRLSHAYLFCGPRGTGKTTMARILAKSLLCEKAEAARAGGATGCNPDGTCPECVAIAEGTHPDVYELDAASRTGVDNVREEIINSVGFAPVRGAYKVYIIDEVHMLTTAAFNALLKTLEEPPGHVIFVLCTTDPQKILETILSRCQRFDFHRISNADIVGRLRYICEQEGFAFDDEALEIAARHARGGMRDALSTLEQLSVFGDGSVRADDARALLGEVASTVLAEFASALARRDVVELFGLVRTQADEGNDILELTRDLVAHMRDVYTASIAGPRAELFDGTPDEVAALAAEAKLFEGPDRLARALTVLDDAALEMRNASDVRLVLEIALTRLARPETDLTIEALAERLARVEAQLAAGVPSGPMSPEQLAAATQAAPAAAPAVAPTRPAAPTVAAAPAGGVSHNWKNSEDSKSFYSYATGLDADRPSAPADRALTPDNRPSAPADRTPAPADRALAPDNRVPAPAAAAGAPTAAPSPEGAELQRRWAEAVKRVVAAQPSRGGLLQSSRAVSDDGETLVVAFPKGSSFALKMITRPDSHALVTPIICEVFGPRTVSYVMDGGPGDTGAPSPASSQAPALAPAAARPATAPPARPVTPATARPAAPAAASAAQAAPAAPAVNVAPAPSVPAGAPASASPASAPSKAAAGAAPAPGSPGPAAAAHTSAPARDSAAEASGAGHKPAAQAAAMPSSPASAVHAGPESTPCVPAAQAGSDPVAPASAGNVDQSSGPTVIVDRDIDADRRAWEEEQVPYDDAAIAAYDDEAERPPFDVPTHAVTEPASAYGAAKPAPAEAPTFPEVRSAGDAPDAAPADVVDAKEVLQSIWGNVVFK